MQTTFDKAAPDFQFDSQNNDSAKVNSAVSGIEGDELKRIWCRTQQHSGTTQHSIALNAARSSMTLCRGSFQDALVGNSDLIKSDPAQAQEEGSSIFNSPNANQATKDNTIIQSTTRYEPRFWPASRNVSLHPASYTLASSVDSTSSMTTASSMNELYRSSHNQLSHNGRMQEHSELHTSALGNAQTNASTHISFTPIRSLNLPQQSAWLDTTSGVGDNFVRKGGSSEDLYRNNNSYSEPEYRHSLAPPPIPARLYVTTDIVLRSTNGDRASDVQYPRNPSVEELLYCLQDPNAPTVPGLSAATAHHLQFYGYGPGQLARGQTIPPPSGERLPGVLPYTSPPLESYLHIDPIKRPRRQDEKLRFPGDLYTPRWVRGEGTGREGWCSLCDVGSWMQLKTSQYWYHVRFTHGVNSNTGCIYDPPLQLRICDDSFGSTFGLCGECGEWVPICTPRRKRSFTAWFKHAHKCHRVRHNLGHGGPVGELLPTHVPSGYSGRDNAGHPASYAQQQSNNYTFMSPTSSSISLLSSPTDQDGRLPYTQPSWPSVSLNPNLPMSEPGLAPFQPLQMGQGDAARLMASHTSQPGPHGHRRSTSEGWLIN